MPQREDEIVAEAIKRVEANRRRRHGQSLLPFLVAGWIALLIAFFWAPAPLESKVWMAVHGLCAQTLSPSVHMLSFAGEIAPTCLQDSAFARDHLSDCRFLPLCARDSGIYLGFLLGLVYLLARGRWRAAGRPERWFWAVLALILAFFASDVLNSILDDWFRSGTLYRRENTLSLATGLLLGLLIAVLLLWAVNLAFANRELRRSILDRWSDLVGLLLTATAGGAALWSGWPPLYLPLTVLSVAGMLLALVSANALVILSLSRGRALLESIWEAVPPLTWGSMAAVAEMALLAWLRYRLGF